MAQFRIPCLFMRGGTSRGTYFLKQHLPGPADRETTNRILLRVMGSPDELDTKLDAAEPAKMGKPPPPPPPGYQQINGLGGDSSITSKVAIISKSEKEGVDIDYTFAQVAVAHGLVNWEPTCGNMLAGVGPAAIEMGLIKELGDPETRIKIRATNNGALVEAIIQTPKNKLTYDGDARIDGVRGTAAPIKLNFMNVVGSKTGGKLLPTGNVIDTINGIPVTCIDVAMPVVIATAKSLGKTGLERKIELDHDKEFFERIEAIRVEAGKKMGLGDVTGRVIPKFAIVAEPSDDNGSITARYFVPDSTHSAMAVTGAICIGCCSILPGSVAHPLAHPPRKHDQTNAVSVVVEHPTGRMHVVLDTESSGPGEMTVNSAGVVRTARLIFEGSVNISKVGLEEAMETSGLQNFRDYHKLIHENFRTLYAFRGTKWVGNDGVNGADDTKKPAGVEAADDRKPTGGDKDAGDTNKPNDEKDAGDTNKPNDEKDAGDTNKPNDVVNGATRLKNPTMV